jgi:hypothetical protein
VRVQIKVFGFDVLENPIVVFVVNQDRAKNGLFGVDVVRQCSLERLS